MSSIDFLQIYHPNCLLAERQQALVNDIIPLFSQVETMEGEMTFNLFKQLWKDYRLQYLPSCLHPKEDKKEFTQLFYGILLNKMIQSSSLPVQTVCVMGLYAIFSAQRVANQERINLDIDSMNKLRQFTAQSLKNNYHQGPDIVKLLLEKDAFVICQKRGVNSVMLDRFGFPLKKNTFFECEYIGGGFSYGDQSSQMEVERPCKRQRHGEDDQSDADEDDKDIDSDDDDDDEDEDMSNDQQQQQSKEQQQQSQSRAQQLSEYLGIDDLKDALGDYCKQKDKKKDIIDKIAQTDTPFFDATKKTFMSRLTHDLNQVDQFFASRTETRIQRQLAPENLLLNSP